MAQSSTPDMLPPLLERFHRYIPGDIHSVAAKVHLLAGFEACKGNTVADAVWNEDKTALVVGFTDGSQTTLLIQGYRLLTKCSCRQWQPARNCPHVVIAWALLKRTVSPGTLSHIHFNSQMLLDIKRYIDRDAPAVSLTVVEQPETHGTRLGTCIPNEVCSVTLPGTAAPKTSPRFRMLIGTSHDTSEVNGCIMRDSEVISGWATIGIPTDLARFMASVGMYESTPRYYETFYKLTGGKYPVVFCDSKTVETPLVYRADEPRRIRISFDIRRDDVIASCFLEGVGPFPPGAIMHEGLLFVPKSGSIYPLANRKFWKQWQLLLGTLSNIDDKQTVTVPLAHFNSVGIRLSAELFDSAEGNCIFLYNGKPVALPDHGTPSYLLNVPSGREQTVGSYELKATLETLGLLNGQTFCCSTMLLRLLNPALRASVLSSTMRSQKRLRTLLDTFFTLLDEVDSAARDAVVRSIKISPDLSSQGISAEFLSLLEQLTFDMSRRDVLLLASPDGWLCAEEEISSQVRMFRILYEVCGLDAFCTTEDGFAIWAHRLDKIVPHLISRLQSEGFSLRIASEPLAVATWEFSLDATVSNLDWFELRPEIRCNGILLSEDEVRALITGNGMLRRNGCLMMMDEVSSQAFALLSDCMPSKRMKDGGGDGIVYAPRLQILDWLQLRSQGVTVKLSPEDASVLESLLNFAAIPLRALPTALKAELRHYQIDSWHWLAYLYDHRFGACLADDMGLGKTVQGITLLAGIISGELRSSAPTGTPHLVVAPPSLLFNWEAEISRFLPAAKVHVYSGSGRSADALSDYDIVITSYGLVQRDIEQLEKLRFDVIIFDEAQVVKNLQAVTSNAVRRLAGSFTLALTGTPVENHVREYYAIMDLCLPGLLGSRDDFARQSGQGEAGTARLIRRTRPFILRRSKQMIAAELPPKIETDIRLELSEKQKALYQRTVEEVRGQVKVAYASHASGQASIIALTAILRLRQICLAPALITSDSGDESPKLDFLAEQLLELRDEGHSSLVFSQFTGYLDIIEQCLKRHDLFCLRLDGSTPVTRRKKLVQQFQNSAEPSVFLISLKAGGKGLNLTRATYVYHMDPWWNPAVENQASDRAHRIGQTEQVTITRLIMRHTIEEKMMILKSRKLQLYDAILENSTSAGGSGLTRDDLEFLLG